jgi:hypothetical protein
MDVATTSITPNKATNNPLNLSHNNTQWPPLPQITPQQTIRPLATPPQYFQSPYMQYPPHQHPEYDNSHQNKTNINNSDHQTWRMTSSTDEDIADKQTTSNDWQKVRSTKRKNSRKNTHPHHTPPKQQTGSTNY